MRRIFLLLLLNSTCSIVVLAEKIAVVPEPLWLYKVQADNTTAPSPGSVSNGYYIELADHQVNIASQTEYRHFIRHIINESGVQNTSEVSVTFAPEFQKVFFHKVILWRNSSIVSQLNPAQIKVVQEETEAEEFQYNGLKRAFVIIKGVQKEDRIEVAYSITGFNPVFANHYTNKIYFANSTVINNYFETIIAPASRKLNVRLFNSASAPAETEQGNLHTYHWHNPTSKMQESQPGVPGWFDNYPYAVISEFNNWQEVIDWGVKLFNHYQYPLTGDIKNRVREWHTLANGDKDLYANMAIRFVQDQVRYLGLEMGRYTHQPHTPVLVCRQRFGDCKDKALLLTTLLQQEGIPAYVALVNTVSRSKLSEAMPSATEFDHAIVAIERSSGFIYVDATTSYQRGDIANIFIPDYGYALLLREGQSKLQPVEPGDIFDTNIEEKLAVPYSDSCKLTVTTIYSGGAADAARSNLAGASKKDLEENYRDYYIKTYEGIHMQVPVNFEDDSTKNVLTVTEDYSMPSLWHDNQKGKKAIDVFAKAVYEQIPDPANAYAGAPLAIFYPRTLRYVLEIKMPENWAFNENAIHIKNASYQFDFSPEMEGDVIRLRYYYKSFKDYIPADKVAQYKSDYKAIEKNFDFSLFYSDNTVNPVSTTVTPSLHTNWLMVLLALGFSAVLAFLIKVLNKKTAEIFYDATTGWPLGGWVIVLGITLGISAIIQLVSFAQNNFFSTSVWSSLKENGGQKIQLVFITEMLVSLFWIAAVVALLYWYLHKRDIFPRMFTGYVGCLLAGNFLLLILYTTMHYPASFGDLQTPVLKQLFRTGVYGAIWVTYVLRSQRVKSTFLQPYS